VAGAFLVESPELAGQMDAALSSRDAKALGRAAHTIKGGLRMFGNDKASEEARRLEAAAATNDFSTAAEALAALQPLLRTLQHDWSAYIAAHETFTNR